MELEVDIVPSSGEESETSLTLTDVRSPSNISQYPLALDTKRRSSHGSGTREESEEITDETEREGAPIKVPRNGNFDLMMSLFGCLLNYYSLVHIPACILNYNIFFLLVHCLTLLFLAFPLFFAEVVLGRYSLSGPVECYRRLMPIAKGLGYAMIFICIVFTFQNSMTTGIFVFYLTAVMYDQSIVSGCRFPTKFKIENCTQDNSAHKLFYSVIIGQPPEEQRGQGTTEWINIGGLTPQIIYGVLVVWMFPPLLMTFGKTFFHYVITISNLFVIIAFPVVTITLLITSSIVVNNFSDLAGIFMSYTYSIQEGGTAGRLFVDAAILACISLGNCAGIVMTMASINKCNMRQIYWHTIVVGAVNFIVALFASVFYHLVKVDLVEVLEEGVPWTPKDLWNGEYWTLVVLPMKAKETFALTLFFTMMVVCGVKTHLTHFLTICLYFTRDVNPNLNLLGSMFFLLVAAGGFLITLSFSRSGGYQLVKAISMEVNGWTVSAMVLIEILIIGWMFGSRRMLDCCAQIKISLSDFSEVYLYYSWKISGPLIMIVYAVIHLVDPFDVTRTAHANQEWYVNLLLVTAAAFPIVVGVGLQGLRAIRDLKLDVATQPTAEWRPNFLKKFARRTSTEILGPPPLEPFNFEEAKMERERIKGKEETSSDEEM